MQCLRIDCTYGAIDMHKNGSQTTLRRENTLNNITNVYFLGIGGIGMSALARFFFAKGYRVAGYDHTETALTRELATEGIAVNYEDGVDAIEDIYRDKRHTLVVRTPAVPEDLPQSVFFRDGGFMMHKRAEVLGMLTQQMRALCVAGTHGKTTTSTILAHLMHQSDIECNAFLGGISNNYGTNLLLSDESTYVVIEADEFDRSFHQLTPYMSVITSVDADHLDIYGTEAAYKESFAHYTSLIRKGGALVMKQGIDLEPRLQDGVRLYTYAGEVKQGAEKPDFYADNVVIADGKMYFDFHTPNEVIAHVRLGVPVYINIENSVAAMALAWLNGVSASELRSGLGSYAGVYRRFNIHKLGGSEVQKRRGSEGILVDDYAHHPQELQASISSIRKLYPEKRLTGVFQPHLYTRTRDFADEFAAVLSQLDEVILLPIYPAREEPIEGVSSEMLLEKITCAKKRIVLKGDIVRVLREESHEVILTLGAGDISDVVGELTK